MTVFATPDPGFVARKQKSLSQVNYYIMIEDPIKPKINPSDHLANERTYLAWIRTSIALMAFGFVVVKFALFIKQISIVLAGKVILPGRGYSASIGILLVAMGAIMALLAYFRYRHTEKLLLAQNYQPSFTLSLVLTLSIIIMSALLIYYLVPSI